MADHECDWPEQRALFIDYMKQSREADKELLRKVNNIDRRLTKQEVKVGIVGASAALIVSGLFKLFSGGS